MTIKIIALQDANHDAVRRIYAQSVADNAEGFIQNLEFHGDIVTQGQEMIAAGGAFLVLSDGTNVIGFGGLKKTDQADVLELCKLHVLASDQGKGYGKQLSQALIDAAGDLGAKTVSLHVTVTQNRAIGLYERLGFVKTKRKTYDVTTDGVVQSFDTQFMELAL